MKTISISKARADLYRILDEAADSHEPVQITGKRASAVLVSEKEWRGIQETLCLISIPGMRESIREGLDTPLDDCSTELDW